SRRAQGSEGFFHAPRSAKGDVRMSRRDEPLLRDDEDVTEALQRALRIAVNDELPSAARLKRIEGHLVAEVISSSAQKRSASDVERWREVAVARQEKTDA